MPDLHGKCPETAQKLSKCTQFIQNVGPRNWPLKGPKYQLCALKSGYSRQQNNSIWKVFLMTSKVTKAKNLPSFLNDFFVPLRKQREHPHYFGPLTNWNWGKYWSFSKLSGFSSLLEPIIVKIWLWNTLSFEWKFAGY